MSESLSSERRLTVGRSNLRAVEFGVRSKQKRPLVLLHGISMPPTNWGGLPEALDRYTVALGRPEGKDAPRFPSIRRYADIMRAAIHEVVGEDNEYDVLGLSWGGLPAQAIALRDKQHVSHLVLAGTLPLTPVPFIGMPDLGATKAIWSSNRSHGNIGRIYGGDFANDPGLAEELQSVISRPIDGVDHARQLFAGMTCGPLVAQRLFQRLAQQDTPRTLVMAGNDDPIVPYRTARLGAYLLDNLEFRTMEDGGHGFLLTRPEESAAIINEFLDR